MNPKGASVAYFSTTGVLRRPWRPSKSANVSEERQNTTKNAREIDTGDVAPFGSGGSERQHPELFAIRCAGCRALFHAAPHPRYGLPVRCLPCADREAARLRRLACAVGVTLSLLVVGRAAAAIPPPVALAIRRPLASSAVAAGGCADAPRPVIPLAASPAARGNCAIPLRAFRSPPLARSRSVSGRCRRDG